MIYIYNPPDREKLGAGAAAAEKPAEEAAPAAPATPAPAGACRRCPGTPPAPPTAPPRRTPRTANVLENRAMKLKLKLDKKTLLDFLLQNVEKIVLGAIVLIFVLMLYSSLSTAGVSTRRPKICRRQSPAGGTPSRRPRRTPSWRWSTT